MDAAVYLDIKEAFSSVLHKRLLWKLKHIGDGLQGKLLEWMQDYWKDKEMGTNQGSNFKLEESNKWSMYCRGQSS